MSGLLLCCWQGEEESAPSEASSVEQGVDGGVARLDEIAEQLVWEGEGPRPDLRQHLDFCSAIVDAGAEGEPMKKMLVRLKCLSEMGWKIKEPHG